MSELDDLIKALKDLQGQPLNNVLYEIDKLRAVKEWALQQIGLDYAPGDLVQITDPPHIEKSSGWWPYRECLTAGRIGTAGKIEFIPRRGTWYCDLSLTHTWSVSEETRFGKPTKITRYWNGPADETPEGYEPPTEFTRTKYPQGRTKIFMLKATRLSKAPAQYEPGVI